MDAVEKKLKAAEAENAKLKAQIANASITGVVNFKETVDYCKPRGNGNIKVRTCLVGSKTEQKLKNQGWVLKHDPIATEKANAAKKAAAKRLAEAEAEKIEKAQKAAGKS